MADTDGGSARKSAFGILSKKIGPVPVWLIAVVIVVGWYWYFNYGPGATSSTTTTAANPGTPVDEETFTVTAAAPAKKVTVPNVVGERYPQAGAKIKAAGLIAQRSGPYVGVVRSQSPHSGTRVSPGTIVTLRGKPWPPTGIQPARPAAATAAPAAASQMTPAQPSGASTSGPAIADADAGASPAGTTRWRTPQ